MLKYYLTNFIFLLRQHKPNKARYYYNQYMLPKLHAKTSYNQYVLQKLHAKTYYNHCM